MAIQSQTLELQSGTNLIHQAIYEQAGSIEKAFAETVMNAADAGATHIKIVFDKNGKNFTIEDNGNGFFEPTLSFAEKEAKIEEVFGHLGFDHGTDEENYRTYGKFGVGRAQLWAFSKTTWHTHSIKMDVDLKNLGLTYDMEEIEESFDGCRIEGELYDKINKLELIQVQRQLKQLVLFSPIDVFFNDEQLNSDLDSECGDEQAVKGVKTNLIISDSVSLKVYNQGVFVREYPFTQFGVGGTVCTEIGFPLQLNAARNDVLQSKCNLWKKVRKLLNKHSCLNSKTQSRTGKAKVSDEECKTKIRMLATGEADLKQGHTWEDSHPFQWKIFKTITHKYVSLHDLFFGTTFSIVDKVYDPAAESVEKRNLAVVLFSDFTEELSLTKEGFVEKLDEFYDIYMSSSWGTKEELRYRELSTLIARLGVTQNLIPTRQLDQFQKLFLQSINLTTVHSPIFHQLSTGRLHTKNVQRKVHVCKNLDNSPDAYTDGLSFIALNEQFIEDLKSAKSKGFIYQIMCTLLHEYNHDENNTDMHSVSFYKNYITMLEQYGSELHVATAAFIRAFKSRLIKNEIPLPPFLK